MLREEQTVMVSHDDSRLLLLTPAAGSAEQCTCDTVHMITHDFMCRYCSEKLTACAKL